MNRRLSLRAQIAVALAATLLVGGVLNGFVSLALTQRAALENLRPLATALARQLDERCGADAACLERAASEASSPELRFSVREASRPGAERSVSARLGDGRLLVAEAGPDARRADGLGSAFGSYSLINALIAFAVGFFLLNRMVGRPVDRLADAAERIGRLELDEPLAGSGTLLGRLGVAFERMSKGLRQERARVSAQIAELERLNRQLAEAKDSLVRSEKLATTGQLAAGVAHEIGNPLGAIFGYLELAKRRAAPEAREYLERIDREVARIDRTVRELLDFSKPATEAPGPLDLAAVVDTAVRLASVHQRLKRLELDVELPDGLVVMGESHHLSQVLINLLLNASDAMNGQGTIVVRARRAEAGRVELSVRDYGTGIAPESLQRIFDPFYTTKEPGQGTGLGLAICHRILESFGGEMRAENAPEGGALFTLSLIAAPETALSPLASKGSPPDRPTQACGSGRAAGDG
ncbi:MAG: sensor histidine kinase [Myxococcales bacterium]|jgi:two-component system NtrC family sensor kinase